MKGSAIIHTFDQHTKAGREATCEPKGDPKGIQSPDMELQPPRDGEWPTTRTSRSLQAGRLSAAIETPRSAPARLFTSFHNTAVDMDGGNVYKPSYAALRLSDRAMIDMTEGSQLGGGAAAIEALDYEEPAPYPLGIGVEEGFGYEDYEEAEEGDEDEHYEPGDDYEEPGYEDYEPGDDDEEPGYDAEHRYPDSTDDEEEEVAPPPDSPPTVGPWTLAAVVAGNMLAQQRESGRLQQLGPDVILVPLDAWAVHDADARKVASVMICFLWDPDICTRVSGVNLLRQSLAACRFQRQDFATLMINSGCLTALAHLLGSGFLPKIIEPIISPLFAQLSIAVCPLASPADTGACSSALAHARAALAHFCFQRLKLRVTPAAVSEDFDKVFTDAPLGANVCSAMLMLSRGEPGLVESFVAAEGLPLMRGCLVPEGASVVEKAWGLRLMTALLRNGPNTPAFFKQAAQGGFLEWVLSLTPETASVIGCCASLPALRPRRVPDMLAPLAEKLRDILLGSAAIRPRLIHAGPDTYSDANAVPALALADATEGVARPSGADEAPIVCVSVADLQVEDVTAPSSAALDEGEPDGDDGQTGREVAPAITDDREPQPITPAREAETAGQLAPALTEISATGDRETQGISSPAPADEADTEGGPTPAMTGSSVGSKGSRVISITADATSTGAQRAIQGLTRRITLSGKWEPCDERDVPSGAPPSVVHTAPAPAQQEHQAGKGDTDQGSGNKKGLFKRLAGFVKAAVQNGAFRMTVGGNTLVNRNPKSHLEPLEDGGTRCLRVTHLPQERHIVCRQAQGVFIGQATQWLLSERDPVLWHALPC